MRNVGNYIDYMTKDPKQYKVSTEKTDIRILEGVLTLLPEVEPLGIVATVVRLGHTGATSVSP